MSSRSVLPRNVVLAGDARQRLAGLPACSVDCVVTSPPYFRLRDYDGEVGQLGLEADVDAYVEGLRGVCRELRRVLKPTGALWLNLRDVYSRTPGMGAVSKSLLLGPERLLLALAEDGWLVRNRLVWWKRNAIPESVRDRLSVTHEDLFLLTMSERYFFDLNAIRVPHTSKPPSRKAGPAFADSPYARGHQGILRMLNAGRVGHVNGKNPGSVWRYATSAYRGAHFATFPEALVERPILATCPERLCVRCGRPWRAGYERHGGVLVRTAFSPDCGCEAGWLRGVVVDPFFGSGTVGVVAERLGRDWLGIELSGGYRRLARARIRSSQKAHQKREDYGMLGRQQSAAAGREVADGRDAA